MGLEEFDRIADSFKRALRLAHDHFAPLQREIAGIRELAERFQNACQPLASAFAEVAEHLKDLPSRTKASLKILAEHGWYLDLYMSAPAVPELASLFEAGQRDMADGALADYFDSQLDRITSFLIDRHPKRERIIMAAMTAHRQEQYELSVPVLLSQADGICLEATGVQLYSRRPDRSVSSLSPPSDEATFRDVFFYPLTLALPIRGSFQALYPDELNRHDVLHGISVDYANRVNSCKSISLVLYCAQILPDMSTRGPRELPSPPLDGTSGHAGNEDGVEQASADSGE